MVDCFVVIESLKTTLLDRHKSSNFCHTLHFSEQTAYTAVSDKESATRYCYRCNWCGKQFSCPDNLRGHMTIHTGIKQFQCVHCGKQYQYNCTLQRHVKSCKKKEVTGFPNKHHEQHHHQPEQQHHEQRQQQQQQQQRDSCPGDTP
ncbi:hypothetical protein LSH36_374g05040 [Paralvinella palmiformis]|uniref:C2H2-type domain-containing protein n=1 Tax=Paralvinella palmiformis TaxID=53620 RepID=A0AAD9JDN4_9ANNE|nr:hypothetical protein LSH36_374g05040 [Paralvinella palmiformis]